MDTRIKRAQTWKHWELGHTDWTHTDGAIFYPYLWENICLLLNYYLYKFFLLFDNIFIFIYLFLQLVHFFLSAFTLSVITCMMWRRYPLTRLSYRRLWCWNNTSLQLKWIYQQYRQEKTSQLWLLQFLT